MEKKVYVGDIGKGVVLTNNKNDTPIYYVLEEDGEKRWYAMPERSDKILKSAYAKVKKVV